MGTQVLPIDKASATIVKLRQIFGEKANIQMSYIRLEKPLTATSTSETFTLGEGRSNGTKRPLENFLSQNDCFVPIAMKVAVSKGDLATGNVGNKAMYTYPDKAEFAFAGEVSALEGIWNGAMGFKADTYEVVNKMELTRYRRAPQTQNAATTQASTGEIAEGFQALDIVPVFEGQKRNEVIFTYAQGAVATAIQGDPTADQNILVVEFYGFLVRNAAQAATLSELVRNGVIL
jgi:hypothetical protein